MLDFWKTIIPTILRSVFSWPVAVVILGFAFKRHISALLGRLTRLNLRHGDTSLEAQTGGAFEQTEKAEGTGKGLLITAAGETGGRGSKPEEAVQEVLRLTPPLDEAARREMIDFGKNIAAVQVREEAIRAHLARMGFELNQPQTTEILIRNLAYSQALASAERLYRLIFGSQILLLKALNIGAPKSDAEMLQFYERAKRKYPPFYRGYSYDSWKDFLLNQGVIVHDPERNVYGITQAGRDFLAWIAGQGLSESKYG